MAKPPKPFERYREMIPEFEEFVTSLKKPKPVHVRANTLKSSADSVNDFLSATGYEVEPEPWCTELLSVGGKGRVPLGSTLPHSLGHYYVQSASSATSALALAPRPGERVLDLCAAPGSKAIFFAQLMNDEGLVVANEPSRKRLTPLRANVQRLGSTSVVITPYAGQHFPKRISFDRVLADVPCSGEGTAVGPKSWPKKASASFRNRLATLQYQILERGWDLLKPGGDLVYSTCTYAPEENEGVVGPFVEAVGGEICELGVGVDSQPGLTEWEGKSFPVEMVKAARFYPHTFNSEGFFAVRLRKPN